MSMKIGGVLTGTLLSYFLFIFHIQLPHPPGSGLYLPGNLLAWAVMAFVVLTISLHVFFRGNLHCTMLISGFSLSIICITLMMGIPLLYTPEPWLKDGFAQWLAIIGGVVFYLSLVQLRLHLSYHRNLLLGVVASALIQAISSILYLLVWLPESGEWYRAGPEIGGILLQRNVAATFQVMGCGAAMFLWLDSACRKGIKRYTMVLPISAMIVIPFILIFLQSRIGLISLGVLFVSFGVLYGRIHRVRFRIVFCCITIGIAAANALILFGPGDSIDLIHSSTTSYRMQMLQETIKMIALHPLQGWGLGSFNYHYAHFLLTSGSGITSNLSAGVTHPHNELLFSWTEGGIVSLLACLLMFIAGWKLWCKANSRDKTQGSTYRRGLWILLLPLLLHTQVEYPFYLSTALWMIFMILLALLDGVCIGEVRVPAHSIVQLPNYITNDINKYSSMPIDLTKNEYKLSCCTVRLISVITSILSILTIAFMLSGLQSSIALTQLEMDQLNYKTQNINLDRVEDKLWNPWIYKERLAFDKQLQNLLTFNTTRDPKLLLDYMKWSSEFLSSHVNPDVFAARMQILDATGHHAEAQRLRFEGQILYPDDIRFASGRKP